MKSNADRNGCQKAPPAFRGKQPNATAGGQANRAALFFCRETARTDDEYRKGPLLRGSSAVIVRCGMKFARIADGRRSERVCFQFTLVALVFVAWVTPIQPQSAPKLHTLHVQFDYDFKRFHGCTEKNKKPCLKQFNVYNVTDTGRRILLFTIPARPGAKGEVKGITGDSKPLVFASGQHMIAVTANTDRGGESDLHACWTMVTIAAGVPANPPQREK